MGSQKVSGSAKTESLKQTALPPMYKILMHNDDYTTMDFVVSVLESIFHLPPTEANRVMLNIHMKGFGVCGTFPFDIAETKVHHVHARAKDEGFPLKCSLEEV